MENRETFSANDGSKKYCRITDGEAFPSETISPIISEGDVIGSVCILGKDTSVSMGDTEQKVAITASAFLGKQMEQ